jgi:hypothetical protein
VPGDAGRDLVGDAADPGELGAVVLRAGAKERRDSHLPPEGAECGAILRRERKQMLRGAQAAGAGHVLHDDRRTARNVLAHVARQQASVDVVAATGVETDRKRDGLALVEILDTLGAGGQRGSHKQPD